MYASNLAPFLLRRARFVIRIILPLSTAVSFLWAQKSRFALAVFRKINFGKTGKPTWTRFRSAREILPSHAMGLRVEIDPSLSDRVVEMRCKLGWDAFIWGSCDSISFSISGAQTMKQTLSDVCFGIQYDNAPYNGPKVLWYFTGKLI